MPVLIRALVIVGATLLWTWPAAGQSLLERPPNLSGGWTGPSGTVHFNFVHRFDHGAPPTQKVSNTPTFLLAVGLPGRTLLGAHYASNSPVAPRYPNEWEFFGRYLPLSEAADAPLDVGVQAGYNVAASSVDGELTLARWLGPVRLLVAGRAFSNGYYEDERRYAMAGGASVRLSEHVALGADFASLLDRREGEEPGWSAGVQVAIPYTPHTFSLHAANTHTATLQGSSRGIDDVRYGFEFTVPVTLRRYFGRPEAPPVAAGAAEPALKAEPAEEVKADISASAFAPARIEIRAGTTVTWTNRDPLVHTVTADDRSWSSPILEPGASWSHTFDEPGTYPFHCAPHPFMKGVVVVQ